MPFPIRIKQPTRRTLQAAGGFLALLVGFAAVADEEPLPVTVDPSVSAFLDSPSNPGALKKLESGRPIGPANREVAPETRGPNTQAATTYKARIFVETDKAGNAALALSAAPVDPRTAAQAEMVEHPNAMTNLDAEKLYDLSDAVPNAPKKPESTSLKPWIGGLVAALLLTLVGWVLGHRTGSTKQSRAGASRRWHTLP